MMIQKKNRKIALLAVLFMMMASAFFIGADTAYAYEIYEQFEDKGILYQQLEDGIVEDMNQGLLYKYVEDTNSYVVSNLWSNYEESDRRIIIAEDIAGIKVTAIGDYAFANATSIQEVVISKNIKKIGAGAFSYSNIKIVSIPKNVKSLGESSFYNCQKLTNVVIVDGGVKTIPQNCFFEATAICQISLPKSITKIQKNAFYGCTALEKVTIKGKVKTLSEYTFYNCTSLKSIKIPETVTKIEDLVFYNTALESITIPQNVTSMGNGVFNDCASLEKITVKGNLKKVGGICIKNCENLYQVVFTQKVKAEPGKAFLNGIGDTVTVVVPEASGLYRELYETKECLVTSSKKVQFNVNTGLMIKGEEKQIWAYNYPGQLSWKSSKSSVISITKDGYATAKKTGSATLTATCGNQKITLKMKVLKRTKENVMKVLTSEYVRPELSDYEKVVEAHAWLVRNVKYDYENYLNHTIPWESYTADGALVKGVAVCQGYALAFQEIMEYYEIPCKYVTSRDMNHGWDAVKIGKHWYHVDCTWDDPVTYGSTQSKKVRTTYLLKSDKEISDHYGYSIKCNTSKYSKVDKDYKTKSAASKKKVTEKSPVSPYLNAYKLSLVKGGDSFTLKLTGTTATKFTSSDKKVVTVNSKGVLTAKKKGTATIKVKGKDGNTYTCKVTVETPALNKTKASLKDGKSLTLKVSGTNQQVEWKSSDTDIATVTASGKTKAVVNVTGSGTAKITATVGGLTLKCTVTAHIHEYNWVVTEEASKERATCVEDFGERVYQCDCGSKKITQTIINTGSELAYGEFDYDYVDPLRNKINEAWGTKLVEDEELNFAAMMVAAGASSIIGIPVGHGLGINYDIESIHDWVENYEYVMGYGDFTKVGTAFFYTDYNVLTGEYWRIQQVFVVR